MNITEILKNEPYLKIGNCTDSNDLKHAVNRINELRVLFPESKVLEKMYFRFEFKRLVTIGLIKQ
jgi:hypothetical protein